MAENVKTFFNTWIQKNKVSPPKIDIRAVGRKAAPRFLCEISVEGYGYIAVGNSTTKKDAQTNAVRDFVHYLVRENVISSDEVPSEGNATQVEESPGLIQTFQRPVFQPGDGPSTLGQAYRPLPCSYRLQSFEELNAVQYKNVEDAESLDINSGIHGNWTPENAKQKLHEFMTKNRINADYSYKLVGTNKSFSCELGFYVKQLNRRISACTTASNKQSASRSCALSLVRQLYHLKVIEAYTGASAKKEADKQMPPYEVAVHPELVAKVHTLLDQLGVVPIVVEETKIEMSESSPLSLISKTVLDEHICEEVAVSGPISWTPPLPNWNPWIACNIDEGPLATATLDQVSRELEVEMSNNQFMPKSNLPIFSMKREIMEAITENGVVVIRGNTGSGKTTQVCQFILDDYIKTGQGALCSIVVTQPRRISAISVAERVAQERGEPLGISTGYSVRFDSIFPRPYGSILFCTVGVLLRKLENGMRGISHVIVDEIHERDLNSDFILVVLRDMVHTYPDLRIILMSATIDTTLFSKYFNDCPVIEVQGLAFPVKTYFLEDCVELLNFDPPADRKSRKREDRNEDCKEDENMNLFVDTRYSQLTRDRVAKMSEKDISYELIAVLLKKIRSMEEKGAVLVFLPGWNIIFSLLKFFNNDPIFTDAIYSLPENGANFPTVHSEGSGSDFIILPLHSQIPREEQRRVFDPVPLGVTKVILSTNIAETSITINDVVYVIDACKVKMKIFTSHNNMTNYATVWASRTNLQQRKGRAGRVRPGHCFHLITKARFDRLEEHTTPEMFRTPLHEIALSIKLLRLGQIALFLSKAIEAPPIDAVIEAEASLKEMKCLDANSEITPLGRIIARLPVEPRLGKVLITCAIFGIGDAASIIVANSATFPEIFVTDRKLTLQQRSFSGVRYSDHVALLNVYLAWKRMEKRPEVRGEFCETRQISESTMRLTDEAKKQLEDLLTNAGFPEESTMPMHYNFKGSDENLDVMAGLLCMGMAPNVCYHQEKRKVLTMEAKVALIHKSSVMCSGFQQTFPSPFFIFGEKVRTKMICCKQMTMVTPLHLLLFGCRKVEWVDGVVRLDGWINLNMKCSVAAVIVALRPAVEALITRVSQDPEYLKELSEKDQQLLSVTREVCAFQAGRYGMQQLQLIGFQRHGMLRDEGGDGKDTLPPVNKMARNGSDNPDEFASVGQEVAGSEGGGYGSGFRFRGQRNFQRGGYSGFRGGYGNYGRACYGNFRGGRGNFGSNRGGYRGNYYGGNWY